MTFRSRLLTHDHQLGKFFDRVNDRDLEILNSLSKIFRRLGDIRTGSLTDWVNVAVIIPEPTHTSVLVEDTSG